MSLESIPRYCGAAGELAYAGRPVRTPHAVGRLIVDSFGDCPEVAALHLDDELRVRCDRSLGSSPQVVLGDVRAAVERNPCPSRDVVLVCIELRGRTALLKRHHRLFDALSEAFAERRTIVHDLVVRDGRRIWSLALERSIPTPYVPAKRWNASSVIHEGSRSPGGQRTRPTPLWQ